MSARRKAVSLNEHWVDLLGVDSSSEVRDELASRLEYLTRFVLTGQMPVSEQEMPADAAVAYGDLCLLSKFLTDARRVLSREEVTR